jgi:hypothetical protein
MSDALKTPVHACQCLLLHVVLVRCVAGRTKTRYHFKGSEALNRDLRRIGEPFALDRETVSRFGFHPYPAMTMRGRKHGAQETCHEAKSDEVEGVGLLSVARLVGVGGLAEC